MDDLIERLRLKLDEGERIARATFLSERDDGDWIVCRDDNGEPHGVLGTCIHIGMIGGNGDLDHPAQAEHIAHNNPKNKLAMIAAHREVLAIAEMTLDLTNSDRKDDDGVLLTVPIARRRIRDVLRALARGYGIEEQ